MGAWKTLCKLSWKNMSKRVKSKATVTDSSEESDKEEVNDVNFNFLGRSKSLNQYYLEKYFK